MSFRFSFNKGALRAGVLLLGLALTKLLAQTADDFGKAPFLSCDSATGVHTISWWGQSGKTFFLQHSLDLQSWTTLDVIEPGQDQVISYGMTTTAPNNFWRVGWADIVVADPDSADFDDDGLSNRTEINLGIDPLKADTDGDGIPDGWEVAHGLDPAVSNGAEADADGDGLSDLQEYQLGTNPKSTDTDGDGVPDLQEQTLGTNPLNTDSDGDGLTDGQEVALGTNPIATTILGAPQATWLSRTYVSVEFPPELTGWSEWTASPPSASYITNAPGGLHSSHSEFYLNVPAGSSGTIRWTEVFTPYYEQNPVPLQFTARSWDISGTQSPLFQLNTPSTEGVISLVLNKIEFVKDGANDHIINGSDPVISYARIGHWGADRSDGGVSGYESGNLGLPLHGIVNNFIEEDLERFYIRITDPSRNTNPNTPDEILSDVKVGTLSMTGTVDDDPTPTKLVETGNNTGVFVSKAQLLMSEDVGDPDDDYYWPGAIAADDAQDDQTHRTTVDGLVKVEYLNAGVTQTSFIPVCNRNPDERKVLNVVVHNFNEPWQDTNGNGVRDADEPFVDISAGATTFALTGDWGPIWTDEEIDKQLAGLRAGLASARIRVNVVGRPPPHNPVTNLFTQSGITSSGQTLVGLFDTYQDDVTGAAVSRDLAIVQANFRQQPQQFNASDTDDVVDIYFMPPFPLGSNGHEVAGVSIEPGYVATLNNAGFPLTMDNQVFISLRTAQLSSLMVLAHEIMHQLTNLDDEYFGPTPAHIFFPNGGAGENSGATPSYDRRLQEATVVKAIHKRTALDPALNWHLGDPNPPACLFENGNRLLQP